MSDRARGHGGWSKRTTVPPVLDSVPTARRWVDDQLRPVPDDIRRTVGLLTSELVTNAVLHAATPVTVTLLRETGAIRVEVADESPQLPTLKSYGEDAVTGRGLHLVSALADSWGSRRRDEGKVVWFELGEPPDADEPPPEDPSLASDADLDADVAGAGAEHASGPHLLPVALLGVPIAGLLRAQARYEELFREFRLVVEQDPAGAADAIQGRLLALVDQLGTRFGGFTTGADAAWRRAVDEGRESVDLHYHLPADIGGLCAYYDLLLDEADEFCRAGALMTLAAPEETRGLRKWVLEEFTRQASGGAPTPWAQSSWAHRLDDHRSPAGGGTD